MFHSVPCRAKVHETLGNLKQNVYKIKYKRNAYGGCVCVCVWVLWACNVRLTPKQLNVEIQEIQVNIKRRNYVNQKAGNFGSQQISKLAGHKSYIFFRLSAKASLSREEKNYCWAVQAKNGPAERRRLLPSKVWAAKLPNSHSLSHRHRHKHSLTHSRSAHLSSPGSQVWKVSTGGSRSTAQAPHIQFVFSARAVRFSFPVVSLPARGQC